MKSIRFSSKSALCPTMALPFHTITLFTHFQVVLHILGLLAFHESYFCTLRRTTVYFAENTLWVCSVHANSLYGRRDLGTEAPCPGSIQELVGTCFSTSCSSRENFVFELLPTWWASFSSVAWLFLVWRRASLAFSVKHHATKAMQCNLFCIQYIVLYSYSSPFPLCTPPAPIKLVTPYPPTACQITRETSASCQLPHIILFCMGILEVSSGQPFEAQFSLWL